jgi:hypothetical protein
MNFIIRNPVYSASETDPSVARQHINRALILADKNKLAAIDHARRIRHRFIAGPEKSISPSAKRSGRTIS